MTAYNHTHLLFGPALLLLVLLAFSGCRHNGAVSDVDTLNDIAYSCHYRNLDSTESYASRALALADGYPDGRAEALNNLAFVSISRMDYLRADSLLGEVAQATDNQIELLVGNVQQMRLCQRRSDSKNFYLFRQKAVSCMNRIREDEAMFSPRQQKRLVYARSEYSIVLSTYLYYIGQRMKSSEALADIDPEGSVVKDTAQLLAYYYNVGSGGVLSAQSHSELMQSEFDYLMRCYMLSRQYRYVFWEANSLQAISDHLQTRTDRSRLVADNMQEIDYLNVDQMPDSLLAGNLAQRALALFEQYGDVYQIAGAWRTLSEAYRAIGDYQSSLVCLENALAKDTAVNAAPDLVASVREQLSIVYSAMDNKPQSDYNRNIYLDLQDRTRQDRFFEARADQLASSLRQLDMMIAAVILLIGIVVSMLVYLACRHRGHSRMPSLASLRQPFDDWRKECDARYADAEDAIDECGEECAVARCQLERFRERNIEQRAKVWLASSVTPLVGRMLHEVKCLGRQTDAPFVRASRFDYISQLADSVEVCNRQLTRWIQLRQGDFQLCIESFALGRLFDTVRQNKTGFALAGITLSVADTEAVVKADRTLTLFMLNTIAANARRYTPRGGCVSIYAEEKNDCVEISVSDTGCGMSDSQVKTVFCRRMIVDGGDAATDGGHGFGLVNCKGIIDKYRKLSAIFSVCMIGAESELGKGSRFFFRLPKGVVRMIAVLCVLAASVSVIPAHASSRRADASFADSRRAAANAYADSVYFANVNGRYELAVAYADSCLCRLNEAMLSQPSCGARRYGRLRLDGDYPAKAAELSWFRDSLDADYDVILDVRNETAVAALALHRWGLYAYNNAVYTQLFRMRSADNTIQSDVRKMQNAESNRNIAVIMLVALLLAIFPAYYLLYYRRRMMFHLYVDRMNAVNGVLSANSSTQEKLAEIERIWPTGDLADGAFPKSYSGEVSAEELHGLVAEVCKGLRCCIERMQEQRQRADFAHDDLRRVQMDRDRLYVSNNVLDNCLSSLKHETMYYPSRLKQLVACGDTVQNIEALGELAAYYQTLYQTLISQAFNILQSAGGMAPPALQMRYLMSLMKKKNGGRQPQKLERSADGNYKLIDIKLDNYIMCAAVAANPNVIFSPETPDADFLVCCQIMRDIGEFSGARGCGITASVDSGGKLMVEVRTVSSLE